MWSIVHKINFEDKQQWQNRAHFFPLQRIRMLTYKFFFIVAVRTEGKKRSLTLEPYVCAIRIMRVNSNKILSPPSEGGDSSWAQWYSTNSPSGTTSLAAESTGSFPIWMFLYYPWLLQLAERGKKLFQKVEMLKGWMSRKWKVRKEKCFSHTWWCTGNNNVVTLEIPNVLEVQKVNKNLLIF